MSCNPNTKRSRGISVSIVRGYGLDNRAIEFASPAGAEDFSCSLCVQTGFEAHPASCTVVTGCPFPGGKARMSLTSITHPHLVPRSRISRSYTFSPPSASMACSGTALLYLLPQNQTRIFRFNSLPRFCSFHKMVLLKDVCSSFQDLPTYRI
jgi:hypothetical protein